MIGDLPLYRGELVHAFLPKTTLPQQAALRTHVRLRKNQYQPVELDEMIARELLGYQGQFEAIGVEFATRSIDVTRLLSASQSELSAINLRSDDRSPNFCKQRAALFRIGAEDDLLQLDEIEVIRRYLFSENRINITLRTRKAARLFSMFQKAQGIETDPNKMGKRFGSLARSILSNCSAHSVVHDFDSILQKSVFDFAIHLFLDIGKREAFIRSAINSYWAGCSCAGQANIPNGDIEALLADVAQEDYWP